MARQIGLIEAIDERLQLLKFHLPYHESDHVLALAYLPCVAAPACKTWSCSATTRSSSMPSAHAASRIRPRPAISAAASTRGGINILQNVINDARIRVWAGQPASFFQEARIDMDGFLVETTGQCKQGMDIAYDGTWGYHALVLTLANTGEVERSSTVRAIGRRRKERPSRSTGPEGLASAAVSNASCCAATASLPRRASDRWDDDPRVRFIFGYEALCQSERPAEDLPARAWKPLRRPPAMR